MALHLSSADIKALDHANTVLLAPFAYDTGESWRRAAARSVQACLGGDGSSYEMLVPGVPLIAAAPEVARALKVLDPPPDWVVQGLTHRRRERGLTVTDWVELFDAVEVKETFFYNEIVRPQGVLAPVTMLRDTGLSPIPAALSVYSADERAAGRHNQRRKDLLRLLYPAYCAGLRSYLAFRHNVEALRALTEDAAIGVLIFDRNGCPLSENTFFQRQAACDRERDRLRAEVARTIRGLLSFPLKGRESAGTRRANSELRTATGHYRIAATFLEHPSFEDCVHAIALVERVEATAPGPRVLATEFSFTQREIEAAQLLRTGLSSRAIAADMGISVNTARRHIERILLKLDVHNRTAAAAKLSGD